MVDLPDHVIGAVGVLHDERLGAPGEGKLAAQLGHGDERQQRQSAVQPRQPPHGIPRCGERDERLGFQPFADIAGGVADHPALGARNGDQRRHRSGVLLHRADDPGHRAHRLDRELAHRGLPGEHHRVGTVEHRVGDIGGLGPGGPGVLDHRLEHLGRHDHRLGVLPGDLDRPLLHQRDLFERKFHPEVAPGHHDGVEGLDDGFQVLDGLGLLQLRDHRDPPADPVHYLVDDLYILGRAHERQRDQVDAQFQRELQIGDVLLRQRRHREPHPGHGEALVIAHRAALGDGAHHVAAGDVLDDQRDLSVVDQQPVSWLGVGGELLVGRRNPVVGAFALIHRDADAFAVGPLRLALGEPAQTDLGSL